MGYLLSLRLKVACDLLTHTGMKLDEIARATDLSMTLTLSSSLRLKKAYHL